MPEFDWMASEAFVQRIESQVSSSAAAQGLARYQSGIVGLLAGYLEEHRDERRKAELLKEAKERRTENDALMSVDRLIIEASLIARQEKRTLLTMEDVRVAYSKLRCRVWPFC